MKPSLRLLLIGYVSLPMAALAQTYCQPEYVDAGIFGHYIDGFEMGTIDNVGTGATAAPGFTSYTNGGPGTITAVAPGGTYQATITSGPAADIQTYSIWVDLDHDLIYESNELLVQAATSGAGVQVTTVNMTIPAEAAVGYTSMRIASGGLTAPTEPCGYYLFGETEDYIVVIDNGAPCIPVYLYGTTQEDFISDVIVGTINNSASGTGSTPYSDLTHAGPNYITSLTPDVNTPVIITAGTHVSDEDHPIYYSVWVDLDHSGTFAFTERMILAATFFPNEVIPANLIIPTGTPNGYTRMRVMCTYDTIPPDACGTYAYGETEDYTVVIDDGYPCIPLFGYQASDGDYISAVQLEDLDISLAQPAWGYTDATHYGAHLTSGVTSQLTVVKGTWAGVNHITVWVDHDQDGFSEADLIGTQSVTGAFASATFDLTPGSLDQGGYRMRIICTYDPVPAYTGCAPSAYGSALDLVLAVQHPNAVCVPLMGSGTTLGDGMNGVTFQGYAYGLGNAPPYYHSISQIEHALLRGANDVVSISTLEALDNYTIGLDMNDDGDFSDPGEILASQQNGIPFMVLPIDITIPADCPLGQHIMRVRCNSGPPLVDLCQDSPNGDIVDLAVVVRDTDERCIPFSPDWTTNGDFIDGVQLGTIENMSTGGAYAAAYRDYAAQTADLMVGQVAPLFITSGANGGNSYSAWIDYNNDNDFDDAQESLGWIIISDPYATELLIFNVPPGTPLGPKRMRVRCAPTGISDACVSTPIGETEDYTVNINVNTGVMAATTADLRLLLTTDGVQLLTPAVLIGHSYLLLDATGRTLATGRITVDRTELLMTDFARGAYTVQVHNGDARQVKRFVW